MPATSAPAKIVFRLIKDLPDRSNRMVVSCTVTDSGHPGATLGLTPADNWVSTPANCTEGVAFNVTFIRANIQQAGKATWGRGKRTSSIAVATAGITIPVEVLMLPGGPAG